MYRNGGGGGGQKILRYCVKEFYYLFFTCFLKLFYNGQLESVDSNQVTGDLSGEFTKCIFVVRFFYTYNFSLF